MKYGHPGGLDEVGVGGGERREGHPRCVPLSELPPFMPPRLSPLQVIIAIVMRDVLLSSCPPFNPSPLPLQVIIATVMRDVLRALEYIHRQGGIHRDVKVWG